MPTLRPGDIVVWDNLDARQAPVLQELVSQVGAMVLFLPPYSPEFNPIEKMFSKLKALLRKRFPRTMPQLREALAWAFEPITADDIRGWFRSCGLVPLDLREDYGGEGGGGGKGCS